MSYDPYDDDNLSDDESNWEIEIAREQAREQASFELEMDRMFNGDRLDIPPNIYQVRKTLLLAQPQKTLVLQPVDKKTMRANLEKKRKAFNEASKNGYPFFDDRFSTPPRKRKENGSSPSPYSSSKDSPMPIDRRVVYRLKTPQPLNTLPRDTRSLEDVLRSPAPNPDDPNKNSSQLGIPPTTTTTTTTTTDPTQGLLTNPKNKPTLLFQGQTNHSQTINPRPRAGLNSSQDSKSESTYPLSDDEINGFPPHQQRDVINLLTQPQQEVINLLTQPQQEVINLLTQSPHVSPSYDDDQNTSTPQQSQKTQIIPNGDHQQREKSLPKYTQTQRVYNSDNLDESSESPRPRLKRRDPEPPKK